MADYTEDCINRDRNNKILCNVFDMSCAMITTRIYTKQPGKPADAPCPFYKSKDKV
jgi:hypothetical protein